MKSKTLPTVEEMYRDHAIECVNFGIRNMTSFYTPSGIRNADSSFCDRIRKVLKTARLWQADDIEEDILKFSPHFHPVITENLLLNLNNTRLAILESIPGGDIPPEHRKNTEGWARVCKYWEPSGRWLPGTPRPEGFYLRKSSLTNEDYLIYIPANSICREPKDYGEDR